MIITKKCFMNYLNFNILLEYLINFLLKFISLNVKNKILFNI